MLKLLRMSLFLDYRFVRYTNWPIYRKFIFIFKKYQLLLKHKVLKEKFILGESYITLFQEKLYYSTPMGLADYQAMFARHQYWLHLAKIDELETIVDVGANVGFFSKFILDKFKPKILMAIEPISPIFECLQKNIGSYKNTQLFKIGASDNKRKVRARYNQDNSQISKMHPEGNMTINVEELDHITKGLKSIDLLKIDVERHELQVLKGSTDTLKKTKFLMLEFGANSDYTLAELMGTLYCDDYDYSLLVYRHFTDKPEGVNTAMELLMYNTKLVTFIRRGEYLKPKN